MLGEEWVQEACEAEKKKGGMKGRNHCGERRKTKREGFAKGEIQRKERMEVGPRGYQKTVSEYTGEWTKMVY